MKLDRFIARHDSMGRSRARAAIIAGRVRVDGEVTRDHHREIDRFTRVELGGEPLQTAERKLHVMLHKPAGILCATRDAVHRTVIDLIDDPDRDSLHLVGRLDRATTGLVLLTNDGRWSKALMDPARKVAKVYRVTVRDPIPLSAVAAFAAGFYFPTEDLVTRPAILEILAEREARLTLHEGRYHQIKRMFHRTGNLVTGLHRESIGGITLPPEMVGGDWRYLSDEEARRAVSIS